MQNTVHNFNTGTKKQNSKTFVSNLFSFMKVGSEQRETWQSIVMNFFVCKREFRNTLKIEAKKVQY